mmetsp:Transcript_72251/g.156864  ORF Transcript_72251/g.156864 Transcript_72251/m.156864 type:complete len:392 (+) Transcript_72251:1182-2357(+)
MFVDLHIDAVDVPNGCLDRDHRLDLQHGLGRRVRRLPFSFLTPSLWMFPNCTLVQVQAGPLREVNNVLRSLPAFQSPRVHGAQCPGAWMRPVTVADPEVMLQMLVHRGTRTTGSAQPALADLHVGPTDLGRTVRHQDCLRQGLVDHIANPSLGRGEEAVASVDRNSCRARVLLHEFVHLVFLVRIRIGVLVLLVVVHLSMRKAHLRLVVHGHREAVPPESDDDVRLHANLQSDGHIADRVRTVWPAENHTEVQCARLECDARQAVAAVALHLENAGDFVHDTCRLQVEGELEACIVHIVAKEALVPGYHRAIAVEKQLAALEVTVLGYEEGGLQRRVALILRSAAEASSQGHQEGDQQEPEKHHEPGQGGRRLIRSSSPCPCAISLVIWGA